MKYLKTIKLATISIITSSLLIGCGSDNENENEITDDTTLNITTTTAKTVTLSGVATDPELQGANVYLDLNEDGIYQESELNTTTDDVGNYTLDIPESDIGKPIVVEGGVDRVTKEDFTGQLSILSSATQEEHHITPLTTLIHKYKVENPDMDIEDIESELTIKLGLSSSDELHENTAKEGNEHLLDVALHLEKVAELINMDDKTIQNSSEVYNHIAKELKNDENLSDAITHTIAKNSSLNELSKAKADDLHNELSQLDTHSMSKNSLALSVENIDDAIMNAQNIEVLKEELHKKDDIVVDDTEVQEQQEHRVLTNLGLENLSEEQKQEILDTIDIESVNHHNVDIDKLELDDSTKEDAKKDSIFHKLGLNSLDKVTLELLNIRFELTGFSFKNATPTSVYNKINEKGFLGEDIEFTKTIQDSLNLKSDKDIDSDKQSTSDKDTDSNKQSTSDKDIDSNKQSTSDKDIDSNKKSASDKDTDSNKQSTSNKDIDSDKQSASDKDTDSNKQSASDKDIDSDKKSASNKDIDSDKEIHSDQKIEKN